MSPESRAQAGELLAVLAFCVAIGFVVGVLTSF